MHLLLRSHAALAAALHSRNCIQHCLLRPLQLRQTDSKVCGWGWGGRVVWGDLVSLPGGALRCHQAAKQVEPASEGWIGVQ